MESMARMPEMSGKTKSLCGLSFVSRQPRLVHMEAEIARAAKRDERSACITFVTVCLATASHIGMPRFED